MEFLKAVSPELAWTLLGLTLFFMELALPGLVIFFFALGAFVTAIGTFVFGLGLNSQLAVFLCSSLLMLGLLRRYFQNIFRGVLGVKKKINPSGTEYIGEKATVSQDIQPPKKGKIEFHGTTWDAWSDEAVAAGDVVEIIGRDNITYKVKKV